MSPRCPICRRELPARSLSEAQDAEPTKVPSPFCSARCKLVDLGNWLDGRYRVPGPSIATDEEDEDLPA